MKNKYTFGYSFPELVIAIAILTTLFALTTINLNHAQRNATTGTAINELVTDMKSQQISAMTGDTGGSASQYSYGVYIETGRYTLFRGSSYNPSDTSNFVVNLDANIHLSPSGKTLLFNRMTGEVNGYTAGDSITVQDTTANSQKTIHYNKYGVITAIN